MITIFYRVGLRNEINAFEAREGTSATERAEMAAVDHWRRSGRVSTRHPLQITLMNNMGGTMGSFYVAVSRPPVFRATLQSAARESA